MARINIRRFRCESAIIPLPRFSRNELIKYSFTIQINTTISFCSIKYRYYNIHSSNVKPWQLKRHARYSFAWQDTKSSLNKSTILVPKVWRSGVYPTLTSACKLWFRQPCHYPLREDKKPSVLPGKNINHKIHGGCGLMF